MPTRRLAAIMFADIVGYTTMMQRNEQEGLAKVRHFSAVIKEQQVNVTVLLDGSIRRTQDKICVNVQLIDATNESTLWSQQYDQMPGDIFAIQEDIARKVVDQLQITLLPGENQSLLASQTSKPITNGI